INWTEAQDFCRDNYSDLVTLYNQEDSQQLTQLTASNSSYKAWIGLNRKEHSLKWSNGDYVNDTSWSPLPSPYTEPMCAAIITIQHGRIVQSRNTLCVIKKLSRVKCLSILCAGPRDSLLIEQNMTWYEAQRYCRKNYTDLDRRRK
ncbi:unnamed protein product, partial [Coregonus sp. 'balchen']